MTLTLTTDQIVAAVIGAAAFVAALGYFALLARRGLRWLRGLHSVVNHELTHNHGTSIKDDVHGIALTVGTLARTVDTIADDFEDFKTDFYRHLAERTPPTS